MIFPILFILTISTLFISIYFYEKVSLYYLAAETAERAVWNWDNSYKDTISGDYNPTSIDSGTKAQEQNDGLYWRFKDYKIMDVLLFKFKAYSSPNVLAISKNGATPKPARNDLVKYKLYHSIYDNQGRLLLPLGVDGELSYNNLFYKREVVVKLNKTLKLPGFVVTLLGEDSLETEAHAYVAEPTEFIRNIDFALYAVKRVTGDGPKPEKVEAILDKQIAKK
jgi:hypothetical protein